MAHINADRVKETTTTTGTGAITLAGTVVGFRSFLAAPMATNDTCDYSIVSATGVDWETGIGTFTSPSTLARTIFKSSSTGSPIAFAAGTKDVFNGPIAKTKIPWNPVSSTLDVSIDVLNDVTVTSPTTNQVLKWNGTQWTNQADAVNPGTVTSVAGTGTVSGLTLSGTVTSSGSLTLGGTLNAISLTTGVSGTLPLANGGTGQVTAQAAMNSLAGGVTSAQYLRGTGTNVVMSAIQVGDVPTLNQSTTGTAATVTGATQAAITTAANLVSVGTLTTGVWNGTTIAVANGGTGVTTSTGSGNNVLSNSPVLVTPSSNSLSAVAVGSGAGNSLTIAAGSGITSGAGGNLILQAGLQAATGGDGKVVVRQQTGQTSNLQEWQNSAGTAKMTVTKDGYISATNSGSDGILKYDTGGSLCGFVFGRLDAGDYVAISYYSEPAILMVPSGYIGFNANYALSGGNLSGDIRLYRDAAGILAQRNGVNAQTFRFYNTYTSATNYERGKLEWDSGILNIGTEKGSGGGAARSVALQTDGTTRATIDAVGNVGIGTTAPSARTHIVTAAATKGLIVQAAASQTANLQEWQNSSGTALATVDAAGNFITAASYIKTPALTVATLPVAATSGAGARAFVSDALAPAFAAIVVTGGAVAVPVYSDGTNWRVG